MEREQQTLVTVQNVRCYVDKDNVAWINAEDAARGLGFVDIHLKKDFATSGEKYETVRWARVNGYLREFGYDKAVGKDDFIPEGVFYMLAMKASNETAIKFQKRIAFEILPAIRKTGRYLLNERTLEEQEQVLQVVKQAKQDIKSADNEVSSLTIQLETAKRNRLLKMSAYANACKEAGIKPDNVTTITLGDFYRGFGKQAGYDSVATVYQACLDRNLKIQGAFDRNRATISFEDMQELLKPVTQDVKAVRAVIEETSMTVGALVTALTEQGFTTIGNKPISATSVINFCKSNGLEISERNHRKGERIADSIVNAVTLAQISSSVSKQ